MAVAPQVPAEAPCTLTNFGGNQRWQARCIRPRDEQEVLDLLERHRSGQIRPFGARHSWSAAAATTDVALDMSRLDQVTPFARGADAFVRVGADCRLQTLLRRLHAATDRTLPTLGAIKRQTISGAVSTGTHGFGKPSLSHFVAAIRVAAYDAAGTPKIFEYDGGDELKAARCGLGCMGVILSVDLHTVPKYLVEETVKQHETLQAVLSRYGDRPLTHFILVPYRWTFLAWERSAVAMRRRTVGEWLKGWLFRAFNAGGVDVGFHLLIKAAVGAGEGTVKALLKGLPRLLLKDRVRVDDAEHVLTLGHHYFRHEEMELFVPQSRLPEAVEVLRCATDIFAGEATSCPAAIEAKLNLHRLYGELVRHTGTYVQHYPFYFRRVLPDDTLISMTGGAAEPFYSISVFTYLPPHKRRDYYAFCAWLARCMTTLFAGRLHWGKHFPLDAADIGRHYPELTRFRQACRNTDPNGVFGNDYTRRVLGP